MDFQSWLNSGVAVACLMALGWAVWQVAGWFQAKADALITSHLGLIETIRSESLKQTAALRDIAATGTDNHELHRQQLAKLDAIKDMVSTQSVVLREHHEFAVEAVRRIEGKV